MASSGSFKTSDYDGRYLEFSWTQKSQSVADNKTTISWTLKGAGTASYGYYKAGNFKVVIAGETVYSSANRIELWEGTVVASGEYTFTHNNEGKKSFTASAEAGIYNSAVNCTGSGNFTLNTINRATTPTVSGTLSLGSTITISTSGRASDKFTHNLYYSWGSQITDSLIASGVTTSKSWVIPKTLAEYIQAGTSGTLFLKCVTYSGSTAVGTKTLTLTITVPNTAEFNPTVQSVSAVDANTLPIARYVVGKTSLKFTISAVGGYVSGSSNRNSWLEKAVISVDGASYTVTLGQNASSTFEVTTHLLTTAGTHNATVTVTDSRGRTASKPFSYTVYDYFAPKITSFTARRCLQDGTLNDSGTYILCSLKTTVASVNNLNAKTYKIVYENNGSEVALKSGTLSAYTDNVLSYNSYSSTVTFSVDNSWVVRVYVYDSFNSESPAAVSVFVPTEATFMDWRSNGKGIAFGKVSTRDGFQSGWNMFDKFDAAITNGLTQYTGGSSNAIDPNTTIEHLVLTNKNTPKTGYWYITTLFYSTKSDTANRVQYAFPYTYNDSMYMRVYYNGAWKPWAEIPAIDGSYDIDIWHVTMWTDGRVELTGSYDISNMACTTAFGNWYRTAVFAPTVFPIEFEDPPTVTANYESDGYGALLWATTTATALKPPSYYLIRPTSATIASGQVKFHVVGKLKVY